MLQVPRLLAIGDSHSCFWSGENQIKYGVFSSYALSGVDIFHIGPITAHGLSTNGPAHIELIQLTDYLALHGSKYGCLIFSFGEIDCRCHIVKLAAQMGRSIEQVAEAAAHQYFEFIKELADRYHLPTVIWGPIPSSTLNKFHFNPSFPTVGSIVERNYASWVFNETLSALSAQFMLVAHINVFESLVDATFITREEYLFDGCHLSNAFLQPAVAALRSALTKIGADSLVACTARNWPIASEYSLQNVAVGQPYIASSIFEQRKITPFGNEPSGRFSFHTDLDEVPSIVIDLQSSFWIDHIVVHNRPDICQDRARSIAVSLSNDAIDYRTVFTPDKDNWRTFGSAQDALTIQFQVEKPYRFVKLYLQERNYFHLDCVQVYARSFAR